MKNNINKMSQEAKENGNVIPEMKRNVGNIMS